MGATTCGGRNVAGHVMDGVMDPVGIHGMGSILDFESIVNC